MYCFNTQTFEWTQLSYSPSDTVPSPRNSHSCIYSKHCESLIIFGGANENIGPMNDIWFFCLEDKQHQWRKMIPNIDKGDIPLPREMHASCIDDARRCMYVMGGRNAEGNVCQDLWELNLGRLVSSPFAETFHFSPNSLFNDRNLLRIHQNLMNGIELIQLHLQDVLILLT